MRRPRRRRRTLQQPPEEALSHPLERSLRRGPRAQPLSISQTLRAAPQQARCSPRGREPTALLGCSACLTDASRAHLRAPGPLRRAHRRRRLGAGAARARPRQRRPGRAATGRRCWRAAWRFPRIAPRSLRRHLRGQARPALPLRRHGGACVVASAHYPSADVASLQRLFHRWQPDAFQSLRSGGARASLYHPGRCCSPSAGASPSGGVFAAAACSQAGRACAAEAAERLRGLAEGCDALDGLQVTMAPAGGAGAGLGSLLLQELEVRFS